MSPLRVVGWLSAVVAANVIVISAPAQAQDKKPKKERDVISREELLEADSKFPDLFEAVKRLRPHFVAQNRGVRTTGVTPGAPGSAMCNDRLERNCSARGGGYSETLAVVYIDGTKLGDLDVLRGLRTMDIDEVRYRSPTEAQADFGLGHDGGAILVKRHKPGP